MIPPSFVAKASTPNTSVKVPFTLLIAIIIAKAMAFYLLGGPKLIWDSHWYLALADNFGQTGAYTLGDGLFHAKYPPIFPTLILIFGSLLGNFQLGAAFVVWVSSLALCLLTFRLGARFGKAVGVVSAILLALHHLILIHSNLILTEQLFSLCALGSLAIVTMRDARTKHFAVAFLLAGVASLTRYEGLFLFPILIWLTFRSNFSGQQIKPIFLSLVIVAACWIFWLWTLIHHGASPLGGLYSQELSKFNAARALDFLTLAFWLGPLFVACSLNGLFRILKTPSRSSKVFGIFAALYFLSHLMWWFSDIRFYVPLLPLLAIAVAKLIVEIAQKTKLISQAPILATLVLILVLALEQLRLLKAPEYEYRRYNFLYLVQYDLIKNVTGWATENLDGSPIGVPEIPVYSRYFSPGRVVPYSKLLDNSETRFLIIDNMHFRNDRVQSAFMGEVTLQTGGGELIKLPARVLYKVEGKLTADDHRYAAVIEITRPL